MGQMTSLQLKPHTDWQCFLGIEVIIKKQNLSISAPMRSERRILAKTNLKLHNVYFILQEFTMNKETFKRQNHYFAKHFKYFSPLLAKNIQKLLRQSITLLFCVVTEVISMSQSNYLEKLYDSLLKS